MCGRFSLNNEVHESIVDFVADGYKPEDWRPDRLWDPAWTPGPDIWRPNYNIAPTNDVAVLYEAGDGDERRLRFGTAYWSLVPPRNPDMKAKFTFNARADKLTTNGLWRSAFTRHRTLIFANGYYEWQGEKPPKTPYFIHDPERPVIAFAGLYGWWQEPEHRRPKGEEPSEEGWHLTATIITSDAVQTLADIHDRNPVILPRELWRHWLDRDVAGDQDLADEIVAAGVTEASRLEPYQVAPLRGNGPHLIEPAAPTSDTTLF